jgi:hypothetical protein
LTRYLYLGIIIYMSYVAFQGHTRATAGNLEEVSSFLKDKRQEDFLVFDDVGRQIDLDLREIQSEPQVDPARGRGRPRLGVVAREVTLLPRHWDWLSSQPGGASVALRTLVDEARRTRGDSDRVRSAQEAAYRFLSAIAGNLPGFEEALRALFAYDRRRFADLIAGWPQDVRDHAIKLAFADQDPTGTERD